MKFTGQVRIPEVDHPGIPATLVVEGGQAEVLLQEETLGRWSLFDVRAARLVSAAFSIKLGDDEITFIADEPFEFAYKGVEHMAETWARYKAMTLPRRIVAVKRSRIGSKPSRIAELREAMLENLQALPASAEPPRAQAAGLGSMPAPPDVVKEEVPPASPVVPDVAAVSEEVHEPPVVPSAKRAPLRPGPGLPSRLSKAGESPPTDEVSAEAPSPDGADEQDAPRHLAPEDIFTIEEPAVEEPAVEEPAAEEPAAEEPEAEREHPEPVSEPQGDSEPKQPSPPPAEVVEELIGTSVADGEDETGRDLVVDLGELERRQKSRADSEQPIETPSHVSPSSPDETKEPALVGESNERSGLLGAVRSAFARNRTPHVHDFVEAPGGLGITRNICTECGYVSIGVDE